MNTMLPPQSTPAVTRVLIVDDHAVVRQGYRAMLNGEPHLEICGEAEDSSAAMKLIFDTRPDLVLVDLSLKGGHGLELCKEITAFNEQRDRPIKMLVISAHDEELYAERALRSGASGYLNKGETVDLLLQAVQRVIEGKVYLSPQLTDRILNRMMATEPDKEGSTFESLSDRELEVFELIGRGESTKAIANRLDLSPKTIETYRENLKRKLHVDNANQLVRAAVQFVLEEG